MKKIFSTYGPRCGTSEEVNQSSDLSNGGSSTTCPRETATDKISYENLSSKEKRGGQSSIRGGERIPGELRSKAAFMMRSRGDGQRIGASRRQSSNWGQMEDLIMKETQVRGKFYGERHQSDIRCDSFVARS